MADVADGPRLPNEIIINILEILYRLHAQDNQWDKADGLGMVHLRLVSHQMKELVEPIILRDIEVTGTFLENLDFLRSIDLLSKAPSTSLEAPGFVETLVSLPKTPFFPTVDDIEEHSQILSLNGNFFCDSPLWVSLRCRKLKRLSIIDHQPWSGDIVPGMVSLKLEHVLRRHMNTRVEIEATGCGPALAGTLLWPTLPPFHLKQLETRWTDWEESPEPWRVLMKLLRAHPEIERLRVAGEDYVVNQGDARLKFFDHKTCQGLDRLPAFKDLNLEYYDWLLQTSKEMAELWDWSRMTKLTIWNSDLLSFLVHMQTIGFGKLAQLEYFVTNCHDVRTPHDATVVTRKLYGLFTATPRLRLLHLGRTVISDLIQTLIETRVSQNLTELCLQDHETPADNFHSTYGGESNLSSAEIDLLVKKFTNLTDLSFILRRTATEAQVRSLAGEVGRMRNLRRLNVYDHDIDYEGPDGPDDDPLYSVFHSELRARKLGAVMERLDVQEHSKGAHRLQQRRFDGL